MKKQVHFLCTGNFYRSRFAEAVFRHLAHVYPLEEWDAFSRGLATHANHGDVSSHVLPALEKRGIPASYLEPKKHQVSQADFERADITIALHEKEHRPMMKAMFPDWADRIDYWHVGDLDELSPEHALDAIEQLVRKLADDLKNRKR